MSHHPVATYRYIPGPVDVTYSAVKDTTKAGVDGVVIVTLAVIAFLTVAVIVLLVLLFAVAVVGYGLWRVAVAVHSHIRARRAMMVTSGPDEQE